MVETIKRIIIGEDRTMIRCSRDDNNNNNNRNSNNDDRGRLTTTSRRILLLLRHDNNNNAIVSRRRRRRRDYNYNYHLRRRHGSPPRLVLLKLLMVLMVTFSCCCCCLSMINAFHCHHPSHRSLPRHSKIQQTRQQVQVQRQQQSTSKTTSLNLFLRPDWMRRAGRIEEKRKERKQIYNSLRKRQNELGILLKPERYRVVSSNNNNNNNSNNVDVDVDVDNVNNFLLKVYLFLPENDWDANDESNVFDRLDHGEIITSINKEKITASASASASDSNINPDNDTDDYSSVGEEVIWIEHDRGGWSPTTVDGIIRLIPILDDDDDKNDSGNDDGR